jgi:tribbles-like protein
MVSLASYLQQQLASQQLDSSVEHVATHTRSSPPLPFPPGSQLLSLGYYVVNVGAKDVDHHPCFEQRSGQTLNCKVYSLKEFQHLAPLMYRDIEGVHKVLDVTKLEDQVYVFSTQPYGDLHNFLKQHRKLREGLAASIFRQIVLLVQDAHRKNVVLRDLKLKKFVFEDPEKTRLRLHTLDDAHLQDGVDVLTDRHGCPAYICPEMLQPGSYSGQAADLWSLGIILYTLLVGHYPFFDTNPQNLFSKIRSGYYPMPENISSLAKSVISSLLAYDPSQRVPAEAIIEHPWFRKATDEPQYSPPLADQTVPRFIKKAKLC